MRGRRARHEQKIVLDYNNYIAFEVTGKWNYKNQCAAYDGLITVWKSSLDSKLSEFSLCGVAWHGKATRMQGF